MLDVCTARRTRRGDLCGEPILYALPVKTVPRVAAARSEHHFTRVHDFNSGETDHTVKLGGRGCQDCWSRESEIREQVASGCREPETFFFHATFLWCDKDRGYLDIIQDRVVTTIPGYNARWFVKCLGFEVDELM